MQKLSDTRWACRERSLKALNKVLKALIKLLTDISESDLPDTAAGDAKMYLRAIDFEFLLCLEITTTVFQVTGVASDALQQKDLDLSTAYTVTDGVLDTVKNLRSEEEFKTIFQKAIEKAEDAGINIPTVPPGRGRKRKAPARYLHSATAAQDSHTFQTVEEFYRAKVYFTFLDTITEELGRRFKDPQKGAECYKQNSQILNTRTGSIESNGMLSTKESGIEERKESGARLTK
ncbi:zinc finger MYM-type 1-like protein [Labeo rohita]|uniref:Zinc finger MYM-type 1-like protein n=1 Tax=Labeo rohita TaxID=84645 RepID=A0A498LVR1_LABRO|nr:zinc finger MYM-type 1-like protein [Labeo rohita]